MRHKNLIKQLEEHGHRSQHPAVVDDQQILTYRELQARTDAMAEALLGKGLNGEDRVAVYLDRSAAAVLAFVSVLKVGGVCIPLETEAPGPRTLQILQACDAAWIVCSRASAALFQAQGFNNLLIIEDWITAAQQPRSMALSERMAQLRDDALALIIFTSGSTGQPKGVMLEHASLMETVMDPRFGLGAEDVFAVTASLAFDASVYPIWGALALGGTVALPNRETVTDPFLLAAWLQRFQVSYTLLPTALFDQLIGIYPAFMRSLRCVMVGGEAFKIASAQSFLQLPAAERPRLFNVYGPTEGAIIATTLEVTAAPPEFPTLPIGTPTAGIETFIFNDELMDVPAGEIGELYIAGTLARGYWANPEQTAAVFLPHPRRPGLRLYKTGDRVKLLPDDSLLFLGRRDFQVKIKGFRVELAEIEDALLQHPAVQSGVVVAKENPLTLHKQLIGFYTSQEALTENDVKGWIGERLPSYMVPDSLIAMPSLPLTTNGKVDRKILLETHTFAPKAMVLPATPTEHRLLTLWSQTLGLAADGISASDHFFQLGGYSLLAMKLVVLIEQTFGKKIKTKALHSHPVLRDLAAFIDSARIGDDDGYVVNLDETATSHTAHMILRGVYFDEAYRGNNMGLPFHMSIRGQLDPERVDEALRIIVQKHESFRTVFQESEHGLQQIVRPHMDWTLQVDASDHALQVARQQMDHKRFDLAQGPLFAFHLVQTEQGSELLFNIHHLIFDGWSINVFLRDFWRLMEGTSISGSRFLPFTAALADWQDQPLYQEKLGHVVQKLAPVSDVILEMPTDFPRPAVLAPIGADYDFAIDPALSARLHDFTRSSQQSLFATLLAALGIWTRRYSQCEDFLIHIALSGRFHPSMHEAIGNFVNTLPAHMALNDGMTVREILEKAREEALFLQEYQDIPFPAVARKLKLKEQKNHALISDMVFALEQGFQLHGAGDRYRIEEGHLQTSSHDLMWVAYSEGDDLAFRIRYNTQLFKPGTIADFAASFTQLLQEMIAAVDRPIGDLIILPEDARQALQALGQGPEPLALTSDDQHLGRRFQSMAARYPDQAALKVDAGILSYAELDRLTNRLAYYLQARGVETQTVVACCFERSLWSVSAVIALAKLSAIYVPLDSRSPLERLRQLEDEVKPQLILTSRDLAHLFPSAGRVALDQLDLSGYGDEALAVDRDPEQLSHIQFTSGTSGKPKGIMMSHGAVVRALSDRHSLDPQPGERVGHCSYPVFDAALFEIWSALIHGAQLIVIPQAVVIDTQALRDFIAAEKLAVMFLPTAIFNSLASEYPQAFAGMRLVMMAGDVVSPVSCQKVLESGHAPQQLENLYGPAEICFYCTAEIIDQVTPQQSFIPIGKPGAGVGIYLLNEQRRLLPRGAKGEVYIATHHLAKGYFQNAALSDRAFVPNPFRPGTLMYRSGDLARWLPDGRLEFAGRADHQVKIRGLRIELGEIEAVMQSYPAIKESAAMVFQNEIFGKYIVGYFSCLDSATATEAQLMSWLRERLPDYMVPARIMRVDALPKTNNGKIDRRQLQAPSASGIAAATGIAASTPEEKELARIWAEVLGLPLEQIGVETSFFDYGGHSLMIPRLFDAVNACLKSPVDFQTFLQDPTIRGLLKGGAVDGQARLVEALQADIAVVDALRPLPDMNTGIFHPQGIFLTGVTGFLGAHLLRALLEETEARIFCLIRAENAQDAAGRFETSLEKYGLTIAWKDRVELVLGDLEKPRFGIDAPLYQRLAEATDAIYHCGAWVHHIHNYQSLRQANVFSLIECLQLARQHKNKAIVFVSTLSAAPRSYENGVEFLAETAPQDQIPVEANGYIQSKWVAERILERAIQHGFQAMAFRPGNLTGDSQTGISSPDHNHLLNFLKGCAQLGVLPRFNESIDMTPVDVCAKAIVRIAQRDTMADRFLNLASPYRLNWIDYARLMLNRLPRFVSFAEWQKEHLPRVDAQNALYALAPLYQGIPEPGTMPNVCATEKAQQALASLDMSFPANTLALCESDRRFLLRSHFLGE